MLFCCFFVTHIKKFVIFVLHTSYKVQVPRSLKYGLILPIKKKRK